MVRMLFCVFLSPAPLSVCWRSSAWKCLAVVRSITRTRRRLSSAYESSTALLRSACAPVLLWIKQLPPLIRRKSALSRCLLKSPCTMCLTYKCVTCESQRPTSHTTRAAGCGISPSRRHMCVECNSVRCVLRWPERDACLDWFWIDLV